MVLREMSTSGCVLGLLPIIWPNTGSRDTSGHGRVLVSDYHEATCGASHRGEEKDCSKSQAAGGSLREELESGCLETPVSLYMGRSGGQCVSRQEQNLPKMRNEAPVLLRKETKLHPT